MTSLKNLAKLAAFGLLSVGFVAGDSGGTDSAMSGKDIVDTAVSAGSFNTLVTVLKAAGLVDTLRGEGRFTIFAPTDAAFAKLPEGTVGSLLKPENIGKVMAAHVMNLKSAKTVNGQAITISTGDGLKVDGAKVLKTDIECSNGVIHVIDSVILPKELRDPQTQRGLRLRRPMFRRAP